MWSALKRLILGKSSNDYMTKLTRSDEYWDRVFAVQLDWRPAPETDGDHFGLQKRSNFMSSQFRAIAFDLDEASLFSLRQALPEWEIEVVNGATAVSLSLDWCPERADLLIVSAREDVAETFELCRFLVLSSASSADSYREEAETLGLHRSRQMLGTDAPVVVLVPPQQRSLESAILRTGAEACLALPIHAEDVACVLASAGIGNQPSPATPTLEPVLSGARWGDDSGLV